MADALLILRTPLQAHLANQIVSQEGIGEYDLVYLTQQDSTEDRFYFSKFSHGPGLRRYVFVPPKRFDIFNHLNFRLSLRNCFKDFGRDIVVVGSVDAPVVRALAIEQKTSTLITVDDGSANINQSSIYHNLQRSRRFRIYENLLRAEKMPKVIARIKRHYTIFHGIDNIVEKDRLRYLPSICPDMVGTTEGHPLTYFIGQPIQREYRDRMTTAVKEVLAGRKIDFYVRHPREEEPLELGVPYLEKKGRIAEEAILHNAKGRDVHIISGFSTATMNLASSVRSTVVLIHSGIDQNSANEMERLAGLTGCTVNRL